MMRPILIGLLVVGLGACTSNDSKQPLQRANPASAFCIEKMHGRLEMVTDSQGTHGICHLPDGTSIDEWELYRQQQG